MLFLHFTFASSIGVGHAGCTDFSCFHSAKVFLSSFSSEGSVRIAESGSGS